MTPGLIPPSPAPAQPPPRQENPFPYGWRYVKQQRPDGSEELVQVPLTLEDNLHPQEGDAIPEDDLHSIERRYLAEVFHDRLGRLANGKVLADCLVDWNVPLQGNTSPDVVVFADVRMPLPANFGTFRLQEFGGRCVVAVELVSPRTRNNDVVFKYAEYYWARVPLYVIVDQQSEQAPRQLRGFRHTPERYEPIPLDTNGRVLVPELGLLLGMRDNRIYCYDEITGEELSGSYAMEKRARELAEERARAEAEARRAETAARQAAEQAQQAAEQRARELEAEIRRLRGDGPTP
jgi:Uma2 family endonuclease